MRIILMHNPKAGRGNHARKDLMATLTNAGHHAIYQSTKKSDYKKALKKSVDVVLVAGGDGTVGQVGRELIDSGIPLAVLPLGTANNLACSLGFTASPEEIVAGLEHGKKRAFDIGVARGLWGKLYFFESAGGGLLADYLRQAKDKPKKTKKLSEEQEMRRHVSHLRRMLHDHSARKWKMDIDGKDISDEYILWEAMNIRSVGPLLYLASQAATKDGRLDFVCAREEDRFLLMQYLDARLAGRRVKFPLPLRRFRKLNVVCENSTLHFDDKLWLRKNEKAKSPSDIEITVKPSALMILQPEPGEHKLA
jgi:diacylglycerol kinase family enzyme